MIYITTFIITLFFTHVVRALPGACGDGLSYGDGDAQRTVVPLQEFKVTFDPTYDNAAGSMNTVACSNGQNGLASRFPTFGRVPNFAHIGGAFNVVWNSPNCGACWILTNPANNVAINFTAIDAAGVGFNIAESAFRQLNGGVIGNGTLQVDARRVSPGVCGL